MINWNDYESEEDDDYNPSQGEVREFQVQRNKLIKKKPRTVHSQNVNTLFQQMVQQEAAKHRVKEHKIADLAQKYCSEGDKVNLAEKILTCKEIKTEKKVIFAGKEFILDESTGELREVDKSNLITAEKVRQKEETAMSETDVLAHKYFYLNQVITMLRSRYKNINSIHKSKMDWKNFVKKEGIEEKLRYHRKGGALEDYKFMKRVDNNKHSI